MVEKIIRGYDERANKASWRPGRTGIPSMVAEKVEKGVSFRSAMMEVYGTDRAMVTALVKTVVYGLTDAFPQMAGFALGLPFAACPEASATETPAQQKAVETIKGGLKGAVIGVAGAEIGLISSVVAGSNEVSTTIVAGSGVVVVIAGAVVTKGTVEYVKGKKK